MEKKTKFGCCSLSHVLPPMFMRKMNKVWQKEEGKEETREGGSKEDEK